jgi:hypothetical protein
MSMSTDCMIDVLCFDFWRRLGIFLFTTAFRPTLGPTQPPIKWVPGAVLLGIKWPGREADHSPPASAEVKERPSTPSWRAVQLKHRDNFMFTLWMPKDSRYFFLR